MVQDIHKEKLGPVKRSNVIDADSRQLNHRQARASDAGQKTSMSKRHLGKTSDKVLNQKMSQKLRLIDLSTDQDEGKPRLDCPSSKVQARGRKKKEPHYSSQDRLMQFQGE